MAFTSKKSQAWLTVCGKTLFRENWMQLELNDSKKWLDENKIC